MSVEQNPASTIESNSQPVITVMHASVGSGHKAAANAVAQAIDKLRGQHRWHILIKAPAGADISKLAEPVIRKRRANKKVNVAVDVDPYSLL